MGYGDDRLAADPRARDRLRDPLLLDESGALFAWPVAPPMTAMLMGAGDGGGAWFFMRLARGGKWHWFAIGFLPVAIFAWRWRSPPRCTGPLQPPASIFIAWIVLRPAPILLPLAGLRIARPTREPVRGRSARAEPIRVATLLLGLGCALLALAMFLARALHRRWPGRSPRSPRGRRELLRPPRAVALAGRRSPLEPWRIILQAQLRRSRSSSWRWPAPGEFILRGPRPGLRGRYPPRPRPPARRVRGPGAARRCRRRGGGRRIPVDRERRPRP